MDGLIHIACAMAGHDFAADARPLGRLGLANKPVAQIQDIVQNGFP
jgi:hypothetical protein